MLYVLYSYLRSGSYIFRMFWTGLFLLSLWFLVISPDITDLFVTLHVFLWTLHLYTTCHINRGGKSKARKAIESLITKVKQLKPQSAPRMIPVPSA